MVLLKAECCNALHDHQSSIVTRTLDIQYNAKTVTYLVHLLDPFSRFSTMYPLIGLPPSFVGGSQVNEIESSVVPSHSGSPGLPGLSATQAISYGHQRC